MKLVLVGLILFLSSFTSNAQIESLAGFKNTISFLHGNFKLEKFNATCTNCRDCKKAFFVDSLNRADTTNYKSYTGSRTAFACLALQKLQHLLKLDCLLLAKVAFMENKYKSQQDSICLQFKESNKNWYLYLENTVQYYNSLNEGAWSSGMIEQINIATIMVQNRIDELNDIDTLLRND